MNKQFSTSQIVLLGGNECKKCGIEGVGVETECGIEGVGGKNMVLKGWCVNNWAIFNYPNCFTRR